MGVKTRTEYRIVPMPAQQDAGGIGERADLGKLEALLNGMVGDGWSPAMLPIDMFQPAITFSRLHRFTDDEQVENVLERLDDLDLYAPESGISAGDLLNAMAGSNMDHIRLIIRATLAVM